jgi:hypothetical protein
MHVYNKTYSLKCKKNVRKELEEKNNMRRKRREQAVKNNKG